MIRNQKNAWRPLMLGAVGIASVSQAGTPFEATSDWTCQNGVGARCTESELADPSRYPQILVLPGGFTATERPQFEAAVAQMIDHATNAGPEVYSQAYAHRLLYVTQWVPGGALGSATSTFGAKIIPHPVRSTALTLRQDDIHALVAAAPAPVQPATVVVIFNSNDTDATANASPPGFISKSYGIAKLTMGDASSHYIGPHEMGHSLLNFVDEYIEGGFENVSIRTFDLFSALAISNGTWKNARLGWREFFGNYSIRISEVLAGNGNENVDVSPHPSRVETEGYTPNAFENQGGMFFGKGTWHDLGKNLMGGFNAPGENDGFGYAHSESQQRVIQQVFEHPTRATRPNDRIAAAGPLGFAPATSGKTAFALLYDGDKNHHYQPTVAYEVQVGWNERKWETCHVGPVPFPCLKKHWVTMERDFAPVHSTLALPSSRLFGLTRFIQRVACALGVKTVGPLSICTAGLQEMASAFLPTLEFPMPYQEIEIPTPQAVTRYHWRFRTRNGSISSGWTAWSQFDRIF